MNGFIVPVANRPGEMARVTAELAAKDINIQIYCFGAGDQAALGFIPNNEEATRQALGSAGIAYQECPVLTIRIEDKPGQAAGTSRRLADAGVNIVMWLPVDTRRESFTVAVGVDKLEAAQKVLDGQLIAWSYD